MCWQFIEWMFYANIQHINTTIDSNGYLRPSTTSRFIVSFASGKIGLNCLFLCVSLWEIWELIPCEKRKLNEMVSYNIVKAPCESSSDVFLWNARSACPLIIIYDHLIHCVFIPCFHKQNHGKTLSANRFASKRANSSTISFIAIVLAVSTLCVRSEVVQYMTDAFSGIKPQVTLRKTRRYR